MSQAMAADTSTLQDLSAAPELGNAIWLETDSALRLADLFGNLERAVAEAALEYAAAQDNDGSTSNAYRKGYWATLCLIDKRGRIRYVHIGEGAYEETERNIRALLVERYP